MSDKWCLPWTSATTEDCGDARGKGFFSLLGTDEVDLSRHY